MDCVKAYRQRLNPNGRKPPRGYRLALGETFLNIAALKDVLLGKDGPIMQEMSLRRIRALKARASDGACTVTVIQILADRIQMYDEVIDRARAERLAEDAVDSDMVNWVRDNHHELCTLKVDLPSDC